MVPNLKSLLSRVKRFWSKEKPIRKTWEILINLGTTKTMWCIMTAGLILCYWGYDTHYVAEAGFFSRVLVKVSVLVAIFIWMGVTYGIVLRYKRWNKRK